MFDRSARKSRAHFGYATLAIVFATTFVAVSLFFASAADVSAMLRPDQAAARTVATTRKPIELPNEWVWRGAKPVSIESMYGNEFVQPDWIRTGH